MLNKHGWGLKEMLVLSGILILFLIIAIYYIFSLYQGLGLEVTDHYYTDLEERLENNARVYLDDSLEEAEESEGVTITRTVLRSYDLDVLLEDSHGNSCSGYVIARKTHGEEYIDAYISCDDYTTEGYEDWRS